VPSPTICFTDSASFGSWRGGDVATPVSRTHASARVGGQGPSGPGITIGAPVGEGNVALPRMQLRAGGAARTQFAPIGGREVGLTRRSADVRILCYHAIADLSRDPVLGQYAVSAALFREHLELLKRAGCHFISAQQFLDFIDGRDTPEPRAILVTFDDCTEDLLTTALPILEEMGIPASAFVVTGLAGQTNLWDSRKGLTPLRLLEPSELRSLSDRGIELGAHSRTHQALPQISDAALIDEVVGSVADFEAMGLPRARLFAYPYGKHDGRTRRAVRAAGVEAAFTVAPGTARRGDDRFELPRIELGSHHTRWHFIADVARACHTRQRRWTAIRGIPWAIRVVLSRSPT
jgi:peptidoglycan/xylan/chitin deacetylase (PgdA/CDA1 family)